MPARQYRPKRLPAPIGLLALAVICLVGSCALRTPPQPPEPPRSPSPTPASLDCGNPINLSKHVPKSYVVGLRSIAIAPVPRLLSTMTDINNSPYKYFAKTPLLIRTDQGKKTIQVSPRNDGRVKITFGDIHVFTKQFHAPRCSSDIEGTGWLAFPGGFTLDSPMCVHLTITGDAARQDIAVPVGKTC